MPIEFRCQSCGKLLRTPDASAGKTGRCPHCKGMMQIPLASNADTAAAAPTAPAKPAAPAMPAAPVAPSFDILGPTNVPTPSGALPEPAPTLDLTPFAAAPNPFAAGQPAYDPAQSYPGGNFPGQGQPVPGYPQPGFAPQGYAPQGYSPQAYAPQSYAPAYTPAPAMSNPYTAPSNAPVGLGAYGGYGSSLPHRGGLILGLSIAGLLFCWCPLAGLGFSIPAWLMARTDLDMIDRGRMDPSGRGMTQATWYVAIGGLVLTIITIFAGILMQVIEMVTSDGY